MSLQNVQAFMVLQCLSLCMLTDAAVWYSLVLFTALVCFVLSNNGQDVVLDIVISHFAPLIGKY